MKSSCWLWACCALFSALPVMSQSTARFSGDLALRDGDFVEMIVRDEWLTIGRYKMGLDGVRKDLWVTELVVEGQVRVIDEAVVKGPLLCMVISFQGELQLPDGAILSKGGRDLLFLQIHTNGGGIVRADCLGGAGEERVVGKEWISNQLNYYVVTDHNGPVESLIAGGAKTHIVLVDTGQSRSMTEPSSGTGIPGNSGSGSEEDGGN